MKLFLFISSALSLSVTFTGVAHASKHESRCIPALVQGIVEGYRCVKVESSSEYARAGLREGDLILTIDDVKITEPRTAHTFLAEIEAGNVREIQIRRAGRDLTLYPKTR